jgi:molybdopterin adenylyltransferase
MKVGRVTLSDRASRGEYADLSGPEIERVVAAQFAETLEWRRELLPDSAEELAAALRRLADVEGCVLIVTTGGTGPAPRDVTPEATRAVLEKELPGFGEAMRAASFRTVPTAVLSRATAGIRGRSLIVNLPGRPSAVADCLAPLVPAIAEALDHVAGFRPRLRAAGEGRG